MKLYHLRNRTLIILALALLILSSCSTTRRDFHGRVKHRTANGVWI
jgi:hypothetical protein